MNCEIISVGTELLLGDIVNTDAQYLARELAGLGISVLFTDTVGDNAQRLTSTLNHALTRSDIVITTGGLGPTADDLTKEVCCEVMGVPLYEDQKILEEIRAYFDKRGSQMPKMNCKQAHVPRDGIVFHNDFGTAPGCAVQKNGKCVIMLPGPPRELEPMFTNHVRPFLLEQYGDGVIVSHTVRTFGIGESALAKLAADLMNETNPTVAPYAKDGEALLRVTAKAQTQEQAVALCRPVLEEISRRLGALVYGIDCDSIQACAVRLLLEQGKRLALAESCTAGYIAKRLTEVPGASGAFACGIVSYSNEIKQKLLGVREETLREQGAVCADVARQMACGVLRTSGAELALGVTGIAGPGASEGGKPAGLSYICLTDGARCWVRRVVTGRDGAGNREYNRYVTASHAFDMVRLYLTGYVEEIEDGAAR